MPDNKTINVSLRGQQTILFTKPGIFVVISFLVLALIYSSISSFDVYALPPDPGYNMQGTCGGVSTNPQTGNNALTCCWTERIPGKLPPNNKAIYCQTCEFTAAGDDCKPKVQQLRPLSGGVFPLEEGILEQPLTPPSGPAAPLQEGGFLGESTTPFPTPTAPTTPTEDDQNGDDGSKPLTGDGRTGPLGGGVLQEPDDEPEDNGDNEEQEESSNEDEGSDTAGPLT